MISYFPQTQTLNADLRIAWGHVEFAKVTLILPDDFRPEAVKANLSGVDHPIEWNAENGRLELLLTKPLMVMAGTSLAVTAK